MFDGEEDEAVKAEVVDEGGVKGDVLAVAANEDEPDGMLVVTDGLAECGSDADVDAAKYTE